MSLELNSFPRRVAAVLAVLIAGGTLAACGGAEADDGAPPESVRLGVFPNVTHAPGLVATEGGHIEKQLGDESDLEVSYFNAGGEAIEAIFSGAVDMAYLGPNPAINGFAQSNGEAVRIVAGSTSGGAALIVRDGIDSPDDLAGTTLSSPSLGNTQDVALRAWLDDQGYATHQTGGGDVSITPLANPDILAAFQAGEIDGAWVPEPWATRLILEGRGQVLQDESDLWPGGQFVTTHLVVNTEFLKEHPDTVRTVIEGHLDALDAIEDDPAAARVTVLDAIESISGTRLDEEVVAQAWENLEFTADPIASSLVKSAKDAEDAGFLEPIDLTGIHDLTILNEALTDRGEPEVKGLGS